MAQTALSRICPDVNATEHAIEWRSLQPVVVGMPQLCRAGLSENWLLKACGHRHWLALAAAHGLDKPDFRGVDHQRLYPAFMAIALDVSGRGLGAIGENASIDFALTLERIGHTRFRSKIDVAADTAVLAQVTMESAFVHRAVDGVNNSATRGGVARPCRLLPSPRLRTAPFRAEHWDDILGFARQDRQCLARFLIDPNPHEDFNGADFLYFSAFQAMLDRAEWAWFREPAALPVTRNRRIYYLGNAELGDRIALTLCGTRNHGAAERDHWVEFRRESDDRLIAIAFTRREPAGANASASREQSNWPQKSCGQL